MSTARPELAFSLRLSRASDDSSSIDVQRRACRAQTIALGLDPDTAVEYIDEDVSGASELESRTEGMARILADRPRVVIAWKLDRFARSVSEFLKLVAWSKEHGVTLATTDGELNTGSTNGKLIATILAALAEWERDTITDRIKDAHQERRAQGRWSGGPAPFPYKLTREYAKAPAYLALDDDNVALCRKQIDALLAGGKGGSLAATAQPLPIGRAQWRNLLRGVVLRGWRQYKGELVVDEDGVTPVRFGPEVVDAATYRRIQDRLAELEVGERTERQDAPWLAGVMYCGRGCKMTGGVSRKTQGGKGPRNRVYKCEKGHSSIRAHMLDPMVFAEFRAEYGNEPLYEVTYSGGVDHSAEMADLDASRERVTKAVAKVGGPALETLVAKLTELEATYARLSAEHAPEVTETRTLTNTLLWEAWEAATQDQRRAMLADYGCKVTVYPANHPGGRVAIAWEGETVALAA